MKNKKNILLVAFATLTLIGISSFTNFQGKSVLDNTSVKTDAEFLAQAAEINLEEIKLGQLAQKKSMMTDVKDLGEMMEKNHTQVLNELSKLAKKKGISIPTSVTTQVTDKYNDLNGESEKKFNDDYCDLMIKGHKHAIVLFETASKESKDSEIRDWAAATLPTLRMHLEHSKMCKAKCEKM